jgi:caffeoyl-CoA O-methyltransferase
MITEPNIEHYCTDHSSPETPIFQKLKEVTQEKTSLPQMQVGHLEGSLLALLVKISGAQKILEVGTFTGYSALKMAEALPENGSIVTLDKDVETTALAQEFWNKSPHGKKIRLILGDALQSIETISETFDIIFVDADKSNYPRYIEMCYPKLRTRGFFIIDNTLWGGAVLDPKEKRDKIIAELNRSLSNDSRFDVVLLPVRDGMTLVYKKA